MQSNIEDDGGTLQLHQLHNSNSRRSGDTDDFEHIHGGQHTYTNIKANDLRNIGGNYNNGNDLINNDNKNIDFKTGSNNMKCLVSHMSQKQLGAVSHVPP